MIAGGARIGLGALAVALAAGVAVAQVATGHESAGGGAGPRVIQLSYSDSNDGSFPRYRLMAFSRRTDDVRFATRFEGKRAKADGRLRENITDTDIKGNAKHPFVLLRKGGGKRVLKLIRRAFDERGSAKVRITATRGGGVDSIRLKLILAQCSQDPPLFPVDCEVRRSGKHV